MLGRLIAGWPAPDVGRCRHRAGDTKVVLTADKKRMHADSGFGGEAVLSKITIFQPAPKQAIESRYQSKMKSAPIRFLFAVENTLMPSARCVIFRCNAGPEWDGPPV
jgi:hypothetical protein